MLRLWNGTSNRKMIIALLICRTLGYFVPLAISFSIMGNFSIFQHYISNGGSPYRNPDGWIIWGIAHLINGLLMFPIIIFLNNKFTALSNPSIEPWRIRGQRFLLVSAVGWSFMCIFPQWRGEFWDIMHGINAVLLLGGYFFGLLFCVGFLLKNIHINNRQSRFLLWLFFSVPIGFLLWVLLNFIFWTGMQGILDNEGLWGLTVQFWEWAIMVEFEIVLTALTIMFTFSQSVGITDKK